MSIIQMSPAEFRAKYLKNLSTEIRNQQKSLQAVKNFNLTGEPSELPDTRTTDEKTTDMEGFKNLIIKELESLTDRANASAFVNSITNINSPDKSIKELKSFYQTFPNFQAEFRKRFRYGVSSTILLDFYQKFSAIFNEENYGIEPPLTADNIAKAIKREMEGDKEEVKYDKEYQDLEDEAFGMPPQFEEEKTQPIISESINLNEYSPNPNIKHYGNKNDKKAKNNYNKVRLSMWNKVSDNIDKGIYIPQDNQEAIRLIAEYDRDETAPNTRMKFLDNPQDWTSFVNLYNYNPITGKGLKKSKKSKKNITIRGSGIYKNKVGNKLSEFGRYYIDPNKLEDDIISVKNSIDKRNTVSTIPSKKVSPKVSNIVKKIVGGTVNLSYEDVIDLNDDEKIYLGDIVKKVRLNDVVKIPNPNKDKIQKENDRFEILKGQILSGNDSKELIKEFKLLLLKFQKEGRLPKREVNEILYELLILS